VATGDAAVGGGAVGGADAATRLGRRPAGVGQSGRGRVDAERGGGCVAEPPERVQPHPGDLDAVHGGAPRPPRMDVVEIMGSAATRTRSWVPGLEPMASGRAGWNP
jgi:hypothetical protein